MPSAKRPSASRTAQPRSTSTAQIRWSVLFAMPSSRAISDRPSCGPRREEVEHGERRVNACGRGLPPAAAPASVPR